MGQLLPLVLCILAACYVTGSPVHQALWSSPLLPRGCNESAVLAAAGFALQEINSNQKDGYVLSLNRVKDVLEHRQNKLGSLFYLTLDVLETQCHVLSKKTWTECQERHLHESVYGQCKAIVHINKPRKILYLPAYNCTLGPVSRRVIHAMCPDCPSPRPVDSSDHRVIEAATESLAKYNLESPSKQYSLVEVTKASSQWVTGPAYFVEYLVKASPCTESQTSCALQPSDSVPVGLCKGSLIQDSSEKSVYVSCDFFEPQNQVPGGENSAVPQTPAKLPKVDEAPGNNTAATSAPFRPPRGSVQYLPNLDAKKTKDANPFPVSLDLTSNPQGEVLDLSFLYMGPEEGKLTVLPFPGKKQHHVWCPGRAKKASPLLLPP